MVAVWRRKPTAGLVHHSDRGTQYTALSLGKWLEGVGALSLRWKGRAPPRSLDNATISEGFLSRLNAGFSSIIGAFPSGGSRGVLSSSSTSGGVWQPKEATLLARLREPGELRGSHDEGECYCSVAKKRRPKCCRSNYPADLLIHRSRAGIPVLLANAVTWKGVAPSQGRRQ